MRALILAAALLALAACDEAEAGVSVSPRHRDLGPIADLSNRADLFEYTLPPLNSATQFTRIKSPANGMHFSAGKPLRVFIDGVDVNAWQWNCGYQEAKQAQLYIGGVLAETIVQDACGDGHRVNYFESRVALAAGLAAGNYSLTSKATVCGSGGGGCANAGAGTVIDGDNPIVITVDPAYTRAGGTLTIAADIVLSGSTALSWVNKVVTCTGNHKVTGSTTGAVTITGSVVYGCGDFDVNGIDVTTTAAITIEDSIFEATGALKVVSNGTSAVSVQRNEFRSNMWIVYVPADPDHGILIDLEGNTSGAKNFKGNRVGGGIVWNFNMDGWKFGGLQDSESNILIGPRAVIRSDGGDNLTVQGNYMHHDYYGGWSQGFNLQNYNGTGTGWLVEHNVIHDSSWPVQSMCGTFRYNYMVNSGHDWMRSSCNNSVFHHNVYTHALPPDPSFGGGMLFNANETGLVFRNNTVDGNSSLIGGAGFNAPAVAISSGTTVASVRNNIFFDFSGSSGFSDGTVACASGPSCGTLTSGDYNLFFSNGETGYGGVGGGAHSHDVTSDPLLASGGEAPYGVQEGLVWVGAVRVSQVLQRARARYSPGGGSPALNAGDPSDGAGTDIGAIDSTDNSFGNVMTP